MFEGIRRLSHDLHPATLRLLGLATALQAHCAEVEKRHAVRRAVHDRRRFRRPPPRRRRVFLPHRSGVASKRRRAWRARRLSVSLARSGDDIELTVTDDGRGFDLEAVRGNGGGLGLVSIEERAHVIGGDVEIVTGRGREPRFAFERRQAPAVSVR